MNNNIFHLCIAIACIGMLGCAPKTVLPEPPSPNIIFFLVDDMGWQDTSLPLWREETPFNRLYQTPNMKRLASQGMKFTQAYATAVCSPSRTSLMTGVNAARHRVTNWTLRRNASNDGQDDLMQFPEWNVNGLQPVDSIELSFHATTLPEILRHNGYFTIHAGKAHWGSRGTPGANPINLGFDVNIAGHEAGAPASYQGSNNFSTNNENTTWNVPGLEKYHGQDINLTDALTLEAIQAMEQAKKANKPFYLYMSHYAVHVPLEPHHPYYQKYIDQGLEDTEARYASMVEGMDQSLGQLMDYIMDQGIADNTVILFMSDNGGLSAQGRGGIPNTHNKPLSSGKGSAHEGGIRVPMIVSWPGVVAPQSTCEEYLIVEDFFPSILDIADVRSRQTIQQVDGISFVPLLKQESTPNPNRPLVWHYPNKWGPSGPGIGATSTIRQGDWKLIYWYVDRSFELYNLADDIGEQTNLASDNNEKVAALATALSTYLREVDAQRPTYKETGHWAPWPDEAL